MRVVVVVVVVVENDGWMAGGGGNAVEHNVGWCAGRLVSFWEGAGATVSAGGWWLEVLPAMPVCFVPGEP